jgi:hypothetical protein
MTAQAHEKLLYEGKEYWLSTEPLEEYFSRHPPRPQIPPPSSACWRGYMGTWLVEEGRLYLVGFDLGCHGGGDLAAMATFGGPGTAGSHGESVLEKDRVFADWFTGVLVIPQGELVQYIHLGYESVYERELRFQIVGGEVVSKDVVDTRAAAGERLAAIDRVQDFYGAMLRVPVATLQQVQGLLPTDPKAAVALIPKPEHRKALADFFRSEGIESTQGILRMAIESEDMRQLETWLEEEEDIGT